MNAYSPYTLKGLYQAIDLIDRKISYSRTHEDIESQVARVIHLRELTAERSALVNSALVLANLGVRCNPRFLPRSFIHPVQDENGCGIANATAAKRSPKKKLLRAQRKRS